MLRGKNEVAKYCLVQGSTVQREGTEIEQCSSCVQKHKTSERPFSERMKETLLLSYCIFVPNQTILSDNICGCV